MVLLILFTVSLVFKNNSFGQGPQQMFWALNKCPLILAQIGTSASGAYSLRKLNCNYTGKAIKIRRGTTATGTSTLDIGFTSTGDLDTSAIKTFIGTSNGAYIDTWYDQSGNGKNLTQSTAANQPRIASNSGVIDRVNSKPTITFQDVSDEMYAPAINIQYFQCGAKSNIQYILHHHAIPRGVFRRIMTFGSVRLPRPPTPMGTSTGTTSGIQVVCTSAIFLLTPTRAHCTTYISIQVEQGPALPFP
ncbi:MAG: hypothetical protein QM743_13785 [Chitinophagaceae bacterium]